MDISVSLGFTKTFVIFASLLFPICFTLWECVPFNCLLKVILPTVPNIQRLRRWANIVYMLCQCFVFTGIAHHGHIFHKPNRIKVSVTTVGSCVVFTKWYQCLIVVWFFCRRRSRRMLNPARLHSPANAAASVMEDTATAAECPHPRDLPGWDPDPDVITSWPDQGGPCPVTTFTRPAWPRTDNTA